ncbi:uncharacterized protein LOC112898616 [Panicum hallii]|uniref:uncharacterized protein LOC112898616 n=1 Tax=Panicum hallii TaxID=206008 RepID=UPI000DF4EF94|nr:uncharacterized protein LOC112898616 [Panicum hallii]
MARDTDDPPPSSPWSLSLPPKIAAAVLRRLPAHADRVRFAAVCRPWRATAGTRARPTLPWLALPDGAFFSFPGSAALRFPSAAGYHGSCDDWLLFDGGGDGYLLANPFTGGTARLPALSSVRFVVQSDGAALAWRGVTDDWRAPLRPAGRPCASWSCARARSSPPWSATGGSARSRCAAPARVPG